MKRKRNIENMSWKAVELDGFPLNLNDKFEGFVGLEECTNYGDQQKKPSSEKTPTKKIEFNNIKIKEKPVKKQKLKNGFLVESCQLVKPSVTNNTELNHSKVHLPGIQSTVINSKVNNQQKSKNKEVKKSKLKIGDDIKTVIHNLTPEDMLSWAEFKLPDEILKALAELGFKQPTTIQQLSLPAAIHGRRDILGAAETGSGKTLAFGLPILNGILKIKEKAAAGLDVYEIPYKKLSQNRKTKELNQIKDKENIKGKKNPLSKTKQKIENTNNSKIKNMKQKKKKQMNDDSYIEEIEVKKKPKKQSDEEFDDSDDEDYVHLSDMLDSDDLVETDDEDETQLSEDLESDISEKSEEQVVNNIDLSSNVMIRTGKPLFALILTPTRELAIQISQHLKAVSKYIGIRIATIVGGMAAVKQERMLKAGPEIVVATPGRLWELITQGNEHLQQLHCVKFLAIDETDRMVERGHFQELHPILERLNADDDKRQARQNFVFSATLTVVHDAPQRFNAKTVTKQGKIINNKKALKMTSDQKINKLVEMLGMTDPKVVDITEKNLGAAESLTECRIICSLEQKDMYLYYIMKKHPGRTIVFCNTIDCVRRLAQLFTLLKCSPLPLHANMAQRQRLKNLERFRDDHHGVLIATDVAARGLDIPDVVHVIHYQVPTTAENYVHRSGRTARANKEGLTILMMEPSEAYSYVKMCRTLNKKSELPVFPVSSFELSPITELMTLARDLERLSLKAKKTRQAEGWLDKAAKEMDMIVDDDFMPKQESDPALLKVLRHKRKQLDIMLSRPLFPKGFSFKYPTLNDPNALKVKDENALQVMKKALASGEFKKNKRKSKNSSLLKLETKKTKK